MLLATAFNLRTLWRVWIGCSRAPSTQRSLLTTMGSSHDQYPRIDSAPHQSPNHARRPSDVQIAGSHAQVPNVLRQAGESNYT